MACGIVDSKLQRLNPLKAGQHSDQGAQAAGHTRSIRLNPLKAGQHSDFLDNLELQGEGYDNASLNPLKAGQHSDNNSKNSIQKPRPKVLIP